MNRKEIAGRLDIASKMASGYGATAKQCWFLAGLIEAAGEEASGVIESGRLTKANASFYISQYLKDKAA